jgi:uncharacterized protein (DUF2126 family)
MLAALPVPSAAARPAGSARAAAAEPDPDAAAKAATASGLAPPRSAAICVFLPDTLALSSAILLRMAYKVEETTTGMLSVVIDGTQHFRDAQ